MWDSNVSFYGRPCFVRRDFDIFEKFTDGSTLWRACVRGRFDALRKMHELAEQSKNEFFMIDIQDNVSSSSVLAAIEAKPVAKSTTTE
jgi:hypothetical protein